MMMTAKMIMDSIYHLHSTEASWLKVNPWGLSNILRWVKERWGNQPI